MTPVSPNPAQQLQSNQGKGGTANLPRGRPAEPRAQAGEAGMGLETQEHTERVNVTQRNVGHAAHQDAAVEEGAERSGGAWPPPAPPLQLSSFPVWGAEEQVGEGRLSPPT